ncbi:MAG: DUF2834 domain-containing protein [Nocardiaceae bacterium]|nr:DUF2834 domain-containing protein [Nocardiaceae bacterium]
MNRSLLVPVYATLAFGALIATWTFNIAHLTHGGSAVDFFTDGYVNYVSSSLTNDLLFLTAAAIVFMVVDARRTGVRYVWVYVVLSFAIAISVMFPLYLIARERALGAGQ